ncbi:hypothetical protein [Rufibacter hautae]|uniref:hypothetical protein n=1 Tax=Rufibacter hautae TaxID=2595005 RepID=UPI00167FFADC|nr:hypothetical protein [Rufibacter hautae]
MQKSKELEMQRLEAAKARIEAELLFAKEGTREYLDIQERLIKQQLRLRTGVTG